MDAGWRQRIAVGSFTVTSVPLCGEQRVHGNSLYFLLNFTVNPELLFLKSLYVKCIVVTVSILWWQSLKHPWRKQEACLCEYVYHNSTSRYAPERLENRSQRVICTSMFVAAWFRTAKMWKQAKCPPMSEWMRKTWHIHTMEHYSAIKMKEILTYARA